MFVASCRSIRSDQLDARTPCAEWGVSDLLDHVTGGNRFTIGILRGDTADEALASAVDSFEGSHDAVNAAIGSSEVQRDAFHELGALERICRHVAGELTGQQVLRLRLQDLIIHTWDLDEAIDPPARIPDVLLRWSIAEMAAPESLTARHMMTRERRRPRSADELLAAFGRRRGTR